MLQARLNHYFVITSYINLAKPRAILPHIITSTAAMFLALPGLPQINTLVFTIIGGSCVAIASNTFNSYLDRDIDALMKRTSRRPLPSGFIKPENALFFGTSAGILGAAILSIFIGWVPTMLALLALLYYILPYTLLLKRRTYWSAVIGSGIGTLPPLIGWWAVTDKIEFTPFLLSAIIMLWTLPHFWTLAIFRRDDYQRAGLKMLPEKGAEMWIFASSLLLIFLTFLLATVAHLTLLYLIFASILNAVLLSLLLGILLRKTQVATQCLYRYSIAYITLLFIAIIADRLIQI